MGKYDSAIKFAEEQIKRMKDQIALYKKFKNPDWEGGANDNHFQRRLRQSYNFSGGEFGH